MRGGGGHVWKGDVWWGGVCMAGEGGLRGRGQAWQGTCMVGGMHGRGHVWQGVCMAEGMHGREACMMEGGGYLAGETATAAGDTHLTGMHSCFYLEIQNVHI